MRKVRDDVRVTDASALAVAPQPQDPAPEPTQERAADAVHRADGVLRIGRNHDNDIVLPDLRSSAFHAEVHKVGDAWHVHELGGAVGLHVNGQRVKRAQLENGDRLSVGRHDLVFNEGRLHEYVDRGPSAADSGFDRECTI